MRNGVYSIIFANRMINRALSDSDNKNYKMAAKYMKELHKLEHKDGVALGSYRFREV